MSNKKKAPGRAVAPDAVQVFRGFRAPGRSAADLAALLGSVLVPACALLQPEAGLRAYVTALPRSAGKPDSVPDHTALLFWSTQDAYHEAFETVAVRAWARLQGDAYGPASATQFPVALGTSLAPDQPYYLIDQPADWMLGNVRHLVIGRPAASPPQAFLGEVYAWADAIRNEPPAGMKGALVCAGQSYATAWLLGEARGGDDPLLDLAKCGQVFLDAEAEPTDVPADLWTSWSGLALASPSCLNVQLKRPRGSS